LALKESLQNTIDKGLNTIPSTKSDEEPVKVVKYKIRAKQMLIPIRPLPD